MEGVFYYIGLERKYEGEQENDDRPALLGQFIDYLARTHSLLHWKPYVSY